MHEAGGSPLEKARPQKADSCQDDHRVHGRGHRDPHVSNVLELGICHALAVIGPAQGDAIEAKAKPGEIPSVANEVTTGAVTDGERVTEELLVGIQNAVLAQVFGILEPVIVGAVGPDVTKRVCANTGLSLAPRPPQPSVDIVTPDLWWDNLAIESADPGDSAERVQRPRVFTHGTQVDDQADGIRLFVRGGHVELKELDAGEILAGRRDDGSHRTPSGTVWRSRVRRNLTDLGLLRRYRQDRLRHRLTADPQFLIDLFRKQTTDDLTALGGRDDVLVLPDQLRRVTIAEERRHHVLGAGTGDRCGTEAPGSGDQADIEAGSTLEVLDVGEPLSVGVWQRESDLPVDRHGGWSVGLHAGQRVRQIRKPLWLKVEPA